MIKRYKKTIFDIELVNEIYKSVTESMSLERLNVYLALNSVDIEYTPTRNDEIVTNQQINGDTYYVLRVADKDAHIKRSITSSDTAVLSEEQHDTYNKVLYIINKTLREECDVDPEDKLLLSADFNELE